ncbi:MAG: hypothetical protein SFT68_03190, partial [Rickettsiaceae bacterium]|nr:hypothetical protein [Rickettsiaceae bacterium]
MKKKNLSNQSGVAREIESPAVIASEAIETAASIPHVISAGFELGVFKAIGTLAIKGMAFAGYVVGAAGIVVSGLVLGADLGISAAIGLAGYKVSQGIETKEVTSKLLALSALGVELNISDQDYKKYKESLSWRQRTFYGERNLYNAYLNSKISEFTEEYTKTPLADKFQGFKETFADHKLIKAKQKKGLGERIFSMFEDNTKPIDSFLIRIAANNETICDPKCSIWDGLNPQNLVKPNENKFEIDSFSQRL